MIETITIPKDEYDELVEDSRFLRCLQDVGVDNWEGYDFALDVFGDKQCD